MNPGELADAFADSVEKFASYSNLEDHFYPASRAQGSYDDEVRRTNDVVLRLEKQQLLVPVDASDRLRDHKADATVSAVPTDRMESVYVDRELLVQRTSSPAAWEDGSRNVGGLRLDVLLADAKDRTPIVGELKLPRDKDPFFALVQGLACAAHLATPNQYARLQKQLPSARFREPSGDPCLDVWVLTVDQSRTQAIPSAPGKYIVGLREAADALAPALLAQVRLNRFIRRIAEVTVKLDERGTVVPEVRWAWGRPGD